MSRARDKLIPLASDSEVSHSPATLKRRRGAPGEGGPTHLFASRQILGQPFFFGRAAILSNAPLSALICGSVSGTNNASSLICFKFEEKKLTKAPTAGFACSDAFFG